MKKWFVRLLVALVVFFAVLLFRPLTVETLQIQAVSPAQGLAFDPDAAVDRFSWSLRFPTISYQEGSAEYGALTDIRVFLAEQFPAVHENLKREIVGGHSLLFTWSGQDPEAPPLLLLGHLDVVPVSPGTEGDWQEPPFSGAVKDGYVWGRGALDDKVNVMGVLEAVEALLNEGFVPARSVYLAFGHDEEIGGGDGAVAMAALLEQRGVRPEMVLDEGMMIVEGGLPGVDRPAALIGIAEKGYLSLRLTARGQGGHSSIPPAETAVGILARGLVRLEDNPLPVRMGLMRDVFAFIAPELPLAPRLILSNLWLTEPLVKRIVIQEGKAAAMLRTTTAPTMLEGSVKDNVLAAHARAVVNFRIHPSESVEQVTRAVERIVDDPRITIDQHGFASEPSAVSPWDGSGFHLLQRTASQIFPEALVAPALVLGATDSRHYASLTTQVYRFMPVSLKDDDMTRIHGTNERLSIVDYQKSIRFYAQLIRNLHSLTATTGTATGPEG